MNKNPKEYTVNIQDFLSSLQIIDHVNTRLKYQQQEFLLFLNLNESHNGLVFILTDGCCNYWVKLYEYHDFEALRHKLGMEGNYEGYFEILKDSIQNRANISMEIKEKTKAFLNIKYQITKGVTLNGGFELGEAINSEKDAKVFLKINQNFLMDLQSFLEKSLKQQELLRKDYEERIFKLQTDAVASKNKKNIETSGSVSMKSSDFSKKESLKHKPKTDLINPNRKKIVGRGAKFNEMPVNLSIINENCEEKLNN